MDPPVSTATARSYSPSTMLTNPDNATTTTTIMAPTPKHSSKRKVRRSSPRRSQSPTKIATPKDRLTPEARPSTPSTTERRDSPATATPLDAGRSSNDRFLVSTVETAVEPKPSSPNKPSRPSTPSVQQQQQSAAATATATPNRAAKEATGANQQHQQPSSMSPPLASSSAQQHQQQSYLNRKAHKFSSLKKKKQASAAAATSSSATGSPGYFLNKLFCNSLPDDRNDQNITATTTPAATATAATKDDAAAEMTAQEHQQQGCLSIAFTQAAESLQLNSEKTVRRNIQKGMAQAMAAASDIHVCDEISTACVDIQTETSLTCREKTSTTCGPVKNARSSPKVLTQNEIHQHREMDSLTNDLTMESKDDDDEDDDETHMEEFKSLDIAAAPVGAPSKQYFGIKAVASSPRTNIPSPSAGISTQELQATNFIASLTLEKSEEELLQEEEGDWRATASVPREARDDDDAATASPCMPSPKHSPSSPDRPEDEKEHDSIVARLSLSQSQSSKRSGSQISSPLPSNDFDDDDFLPSDYKPSGSGGSVMMTILSNVMSTVSPASSPTSTKKLPHSLVETFTWVEVQAKIAAAVMSAQEEWNATALEDLQFQHNVKLAMALNEQKEHAAQTLQERMDQMKTEHEKELAAFSDTFQAKFHELKGQAQSSQQVTRQRERQLEEMEAELNTLRHASQERAVLEGRLTELMAAHYAVQGDLTKERKTIQELKAKGRQDLLALEKEKDQQVASFRHEISGLEEMNRKLQAELVEAKHDVQFEMDEHIEIVKNDLQSVQHHLKDTQFQLDKCREELADRDFTVTKLKDELSVALIDLTACKRTLSDKKEQIDFLREQLDDTTSSARDSALLPQLDKLQESLNEKHAQVDILARKLADKENVLGEAKQTICDMQSRIDGMQQQMTAKEAEARSSPKFRQKLAGLERENAQLKEELKSCMKHSSYELKLSSSEDSQLSSASRASGITPPRPSILSSPLHSTPSKKRESLHQSSTDLIMRKEKDERIGILETELSTVRKKLHDAEAEVECMKCSNMSSPKKSVRFLGGSFAHSPESEAPSEELHDDNARYSSLAISDLQHRLEGKARALHTAGMEVSLRNSPHVEEMSIDHLQRQIVHLEQQLSAMQDELLVKDCELAAITKSGESTTDSISFDQDKQELLDLRNQIANLLVEKERDGNELRRRLAFVQAALAEKEKELSAMLSRTQLLRTSDSFSQASSPVSKANSSKSTSSAAIINDCVRDNTELNEREKEALRQQIAVLEDQIESLTRGHEKTLADLRRASEQELVELKREMETRIEKHMRIERELKDALSSVDSADKEDLIEKIEQLESAKKADRTGGLREVQKKEELLQRISLMEKKERELSNEHEFNLQKVREASELEIRRLRKEIEKTTKDSQEREWELQQAISATASFEKEELLQSIDKLEALLESERNCSVLIKMKVSSLEKEAKHNAEAHRDELLEQENRFQAEVQCLQRQLCDLNGIEDAMQITTNDRDTLDHELRQTKEALERCQTEYHERFTQMQMSHAEEVAKLKSELNAEIEKTENNAMESIEELESKICDLERTIAEKDADVGRKSDELTRIKTLAAEETKKLLAELETLRSTAGADTQSYQVRIQALEKEHAKDVTEITNCLNKTKAEHETKIGGLESLLNDKDAALVALGDQLAEAKKRCKGLEESASVMSSELEATKEAASKASKELSSVMSDLASLKATHERYIEESAAATEMACDEARQETIQHAEIQFKQANQLYVKLKKQYDLSKKKVEILEKDLATTKGRLDKADSVEASLKEEMAELKVLRAKIEADAARKAKEYRREMERLLKGAEGFEKKLKESEAANRQHAKKLALVNSEKEKLQKEYIEIKNVCEELMTMVESQQEENHEY